MNKYTTKNPKHEVILGELKTDDLKSGGGNEEDVIFALLVLLKKFDPLIFEKFGMPHIQMMAKCLGCLKDCEMTHNSFENIELVKKQVRKQE
jgi:hypothetical protein